MRAVAGGNVSVNRTASIGLVQAVSESAPLGSHRSCNGRAQITATVYDALNRIAARIDALGRRMTGIYDAVSRPVASVSALNDRSTTVYLFCGLVVSRCLIRVEPMSESTHVRIIAAMRESGRRCKMATVNRIRPGFLNRALDLRRLAAVMHQAAVRATRSLLRPIFVRPPRRQRPDCHAAALDKHFDIRKGIRNRRSVAVGTGHRHGCFANVNCEQVG